MFKKAKKNKKGFTLAELLIVVAIIAVLVAISIPIFNSQLEKSREATDLANIRAAYAEVMTAALTEDTTTGNSTENGAIKYTAGTTGASATGASWEKVVTLNQKKDNWQTDVTEVKIGTVSMTTNSNTPKAGGNATIKYTAGTSASVEGTVTITFS